MSSIIVIYDEEVNYIDLDDKDEWHNPDPFVNIDHHAIMATNRALKMRWSSSIYEDLTFLGVLNDLIDQESVIQQAPEPISESSYIHIPEYLRYSSLIVVEEPKKHRELLVDLWIAKLIKGVELRKAWAELQEPEY